MKITTKIKKYAPQWLIEEYEKAAELNKKVAEKADEDGLVQIGDGDRDLIPSFDDELCSLHKNGRITSITFNLPSMENYQRHREIALLNAERLIPVWREVAKNGCRKPDLLLREIYLNLTSDREHHKKKDRRDAKTKALKLLSELSRLQKKYDIFPELMDFYLDEKERGTLTAPIPDDFREAFKQHLLVDKCLPYFSEVLERAADDLESYSTQSKLPRSTGDDKKDREIIFIRGMGEYFKRKCGKYLYGTIATITSVFLNIEYDKQQIRDIMATKTRPN